VVGVWWEGGGKVVGRWWEGGGNLVGIWWGNNNFHRADGPAEQLLIKTGSRGLRDLSLGGPLVEASSCGGGQLSPKKEVRAAAREGPLGPAHAALHDELGCGSLGEAAMPQDEATEPSSDSASDHPDIAKPTRNDATTPSQKILRRPGNKINRVSGEQ
jgi:hypothetical protein